MSDDVDRELPALTGGLLAKVPMMKPLPEDKLAKLAELMFARVASDWGGRPGQEYKELSEFLRDAGLAPPPVEGVFEAYYRDQNIRRTKEWLLSYLTELNCRVAQGNFFPLGIERIVLSLLASADRHRVAAEFERLFDSVGVDVTFDRTSDTYVLATTELKADDQEPRKSVPVILHEHLGLHPRVYEASRGLFEDGHFAQAAFEASKVLEQILRERLTRVGEAADLSGTRLANLAFAERQPLLHINRLETQTDRDEHSGMRFLLVGALLAIRNPLAHEDIHLDPYEALEKLALISLLVKKIEATESA